jgi:hypothetical protein
MKWLKRLFEKKKAKVAPIGSSNIPVILNSVCYHGRFKKAIKYLDCENTDCKTCECNQQID